MSVCVHERGHRCVSAAMCVCVGQACSHKHLCTCVLLVNTWCMLMSTRLLDVVVCVHVSVYAYIHWHVFTRVCPGVYLCVCVCITRVRVPVSLPARGDTCLCVCLLALAGELVLIWPDPGLDPPGVAWHSGLLREDEGSGMPGRCRAWGLVMVGGWGSGSGPCQRPAPQPQACPAPAKAPAPSPCCVWPRHTEGWHP